MRDLKVGSQQRGMVENVGGGQHCVVDGNAWGQRQGSLEGVGLWAM